MNTNLNPVLENAPVPQDAQQACEVEVWEPPFERWMRIADSSLTQVPGRYCEIYPLRKS